MKALSLLLIFCASFVQAQEFNPFEENYKPTLNEDYRILGFTQQAWTGSSWINLSKATYSYDSTTYVDEILTENWINNSWQIVLKTEYNYILTDLDEVLNKAWNGTGFENYNHSLFTYDSSGANTEILAQNWVNQSWVNSVKVTYSYNLGKIDTVLNASWTGGDWVTASREIRSYNSNDTLTTAITQNLNGASWVNATKQSYSYNVLGDVSQILTESWNGTSWANQNLFIAVFDTLNNLSEAEYKSWNGNSWTDFVRTFYTYELIPVAIEENPNLISDFKLSNYPNPFNPSTTINYELEITNYELAKLTIFNVLGQRIKDFNLTEPKGSVVWNGTDNFGKSVSSGVYFYRIQTGKQTHAKKMLLLK
ncbi:MAG: T9SS C-terminal target domain-containing protein [Calditrichaeota bacterium]|nr:MAG: T9SS C-terminal target domain-containing protein [Calditrichota bacterium]